MTRPNEHVAHLSSHRAVLTALACAALSVLAGEAAQAGRTIQSRSGHLLVFQDSEPAELGGVAGGEWAPSLSVDPATGAKQLGDAMVSPLSLQAPIATSSESLLERVAAFVAGSLQSFDFEVVEASGEDEWTATPFYDAHITEVTFPAFDANGKEQAPLSLGLVAGDRGDSRTSDLASNLPSVGETSEQKAWLASSFKFELGSLPCERVARIDSFTLEQSVTVDGSARVEVPNLKITFSAADAEAWQDWYDRFVIRGESSDADEIDGTITYLDPSHTEILFRLHLYGVGILSIAPAPDVPDAFEVEIYVEEASADVAVETLEIAHEGLRY